VVLLDGRAQQARDADAVAAHLEMLAACRPRRGRWRSWPGCTWCPGRTHGRPRCRAGWPARPCRRARVAFDHVAHVGHEFGLGQVAAPVHAGEMWCPPLAPQTKSAIAATVRSATP
jgi:hypothetical protein